MAFVLDESIQNFILFSKSLLREFNFSWGKAASIPLLTLIKLTSLTLFSISKFSISWSTGSVSCYLNLSCGIAWTSNLFIVY